MGYDRNLGRPRVLPNNKGSEKQDQSLDVPCSPTNGSTENQVAPSESIGARAGDNMIDRPQCIPGPVTLCEDFNGDQSNENYSNPAIKIDDLVSISKVETSSMIRSVTLKLISAFILALILLYVSSHAISIFRDAFSLPSPIKHIALGVLAVLIAFIIYVMIKTIRFILRLSDRSQLNLKQLHNASTFTNNKSYKIAKEEFLEPYIKTLRQRSPALEKSFISTEEMKNILDATQRLLDPDRIISNEEWFNEFVDKIQIPMEEIAMSRIHYYGKLVGLKTSISPWAFIDMIAIIYNSMLMIADIALLFNRKFSKGDTIRVLLDLFVSIYITGNTQEAVNSIEDGLEGVPSPSSNVDEAGDAASDTIMDVASRTLGPIVTSIGKGAAKKLVEGMTNYWLVKRLGKRTMNMLKPIG